MHDARIVRAYRADERAFTRVRKLPFGKVVGLILSGWKMSLQTRINRFFRELKLLDKLPTASAFCQARMKVKPELFKLLNEETVKGFYEDYGKAGLVQRWQGHLVWAIDGTILNLPDTPETRERYTVQINQHDEEGAVQGMGSVLHDVLNGVAINATLDEKKSEKSFVFDDHSLYFRDEAIVLYDRLYADYSVMAFHTQQRANFVIRAPLSNTFKKVEEFAHSDRTDEGVTLRVTYKQRGFVKERRLAKEIRVRLVKVVLDDGTVEVLLTSLLDKERYPTEEFRELYKKRWGIETYFDRLKNLLEVERFSSKKVIGIEQDFWGVVFLSSLASVLSKEEEEEARAGSRRKGLKYEYKVNMSVCYSAIAECVIDLLLDESKSPEEAEEEIRKMVRMALVPERPGRWSERKPGSTSRKLRFNKYAKRIWS